MCSRREGGGGGGGVWSNDPIPTLNANDEPRGEASICSPDVCEMVARVIKRWREHGPLWVSASTKTLKCFTEEALHYREQFPKNTISLTDFPSSRQQFSLFPSAIKIPLNVWDASHLQPSITANSSTSLLFCFIKVPFFFFCIQFGRGKNCVFKLLLTAAEIAPKCCFSKCRKTKVIYISATAPSIGCENDESVLSGAVEGIRWCYKNRRGSRKTPSLRVEWVSRTNRVT